MSSFFKEPTRKLTPAGANADARLKYLTDMMHGERKRYTSASLASAFGIVLSLSRPMPVLDSEHVCGLSRELMAEEARQSRNLMERRDKKTLVGSDTKYIGK